MASMVISYGKLVARFGIKKDQLQEVSVMGKLQQRPKKHKAEQNKRVVEFKHRLEVKGSPTTSRQDAP